MGEKGLLKRYARALGVAYEALAFYADPETYHAIAVLADPPCGDFWNDIGNEHYNERYGHKPGKKARKAIRKLHKSYGDLTFTTREELGGSWELSNPASVKNIPQYIDTSKETAG